MSPPQRCRLRFAVLLVALVAAACSGGETMGIPDGGGVDAVPDPCAGRCSEVELCVQGSEGEYECAMICANQLHCWSGCCVPAEGQPYTVCRPANICFGP
jgi:hypothetical protein